MHLVGCAPTSGLWGFWNNHFTLLFLSLLGSRATQTVHSHWGERQLHATFTPAHRGCCWVSVTALLIFDQSRHETTLCSFSPISVLASLECLCTSSPVDVCLWFSCLRYCICSWPATPQADWIGYTPLFLLHHPTPALFLSLSLSLPLVPLCNGTKALLGMAWHLLAHFVSSSFYVESFLGREKFWVIYLISSIIFWVVQNNIGLTSLLTMACCYFFFLLGSNTATSSYSAASWTCSDSTDTHFPIERMVFLKSLLEMEDSNFNCLIHYSG